MLACLYGKSIDLLPLELVVLNQRFSIKRPEVRSLGMRLSILVTALGLFLLGIVGMGCEKPPAPSTLDTQLCVRCKHHEWTVPDVTVYLKYGEDVNQFPGYEPLEYDTSFQTDAAGRLCLKGINYGDYWLMGAAFDPEWGDEVRGAIYLDFSKRNARLDTILVLNEF